jgi:glutamyl-tRNA reductase
MLIGNLRIIQLRKGSGQGVHLPHATETVRAALPEAFFLDSCQRQLWVCDDTQLEAAELRGAFSGVQGLELFEGVDAYAFLLRVATGLESQVVGETDIFGQLKEAWKKYPGNLELALLMQRVFEDTKDVRARYLQNLGGASYGSLVRMLLQNSDGKERKGPTLIVGAGQLAQSVAPYLMDGEVWLSNRNAENLGVLYADLIGRQGAARLGHDQHEIRVISKAEEEQAWKEARNVIICIPFDETADASRIEARKGRDGTVVHLGGMAEQAGEWNQLSSFHSLDDLFALQKSQGEARMIQVMQANRACQEKAKLRSLGASVTIPHGWEDLAVFA